MNTEKISLENENMNKVKTPQLNIGDISCLLHSDEQIKEASDEWVFDINGMKWSNNDDTAGDNYGSFIAGVNWLIKFLSNDR